MDWADEAAGAISTPLRLEVPKEVADDVHLRIAAAIRQAQGDIEGEVCPHWTVEKARDHRKALTRTINHHREYAEKARVSRDYEGHIREADKFEALRDEIDMLIEQVQP